jgi:hypothetical protein
LANGARAHLGIDFTASCGRFTEIALVNGSGGAEAIERDQSDDCRVPNQQGEQVELPLEARHDYSDSSIAIGPHPWVGVAFEAVHLHGFFFGKNWDQPWSLHFPNGGTFEYTEAISAERWFQTYFVMLWVAAHLYVCFYSTFLRALSFRMCGKAELTSRKQSSVGGSLAPTTFQPCHVRIVFAMAIVVARYVCWPCWLAIYVSVSGVR